MRKFGFLFTIGIIFLPLLSCQSETQPNLKNETEHQAEKSRDAIEVDAIEEYLLLHNIPAQKTASGVYYFIKDDGFGEAVKRGSTVMFNAYGTLLRGDEFFSTYNNRHPVRITIGNKETIQGLEDGLTYFNSGGSGTIFIPSSLAYGVAGFGTKVPPNSILVYNVEILSVETDEE